MVKGPLCHIAHNSKATYNYNVYYDLALSLLAMSMFEVLQTFPTQWKALILILGAIDPSNSHLITLDLDNSEPWLPSLVTF